MEKSRYIYLSLVVAMAAGLAVFTTAICDDDASFDALCYTSASFGFEELFAHIISQKGEFHEYCEDTISPRPIISYLARQEKSPPAV